MPIKARTDFAAAINQVVSEKGIDIAVVLEAIEQSALAAYRKDLSLRGEAIPDDFDDLKAKIDPVTGEISILRGASNITPPGFARIAAQTAKQVIMQRLHEAEKGAIMDEYDKKVGTVISGTIQRQEGNTFFVDLGRAEGIMPPSEQTRDEYYHLGQRLKVYIKEIREGRRGPEVVVSRSDANLVKGLFAMEVPELQTGAVVIKGIAREAGSRTKISAASTQEGVDPVGSLVGQKGVRVQAVITELGEEKIDVITFSEDQQRYIAAALSPVKDVLVTLKEDGEEKLAKVKVPTSQLSLAIGKGGQNVRLAARLTGWRIDVEGAGEDKAEKKEEEASVTEDLEKQIDEAVEKEAGYVEPEPTVVEAKSAEKVAKEDIEEAEGKTGSMEETADTDRGDILANQNPSEEDAPTVANTSEAPNVSSVEPPFEEPSNQEKSDQNEK